jgi:hypothetical protein
MLASTSPEHTEAMDGLDVEAIFDQIPAEVVDAHPSLLMVVAQRHGAEFQYDRRAVLVERARRVAAQTGDVVLARATEADLYRTLGMRSSLSAVLVDKANYIDFSLGRTAVALAEIDEALDLVVDRPQRWAYVMCCRAKVAADLGFDDQCRANVTEVLRVAEQFDSAVLRAYGHRRLGVLDSYNGDAEHFRRGAASRTGPGRQLVVATIRHFSVRGSRLFEPSGLQRSRLGIPGAGEGRSERRRSRD